MRRGSFRISNSLPHRVVSAVRSPWSCCCQKCCPQIWPTPYPIEFGLEASNVVVNERHPEIRPCIWATLDNFFAATSGLPLQSLGTIMNHADTRALGKTIEGAQDGRNKAIRTVLGMLSSAVAVETASFMVDTSVCCILRRAYQDMPLPLDNATTTERWRHSVTTPCTAINFIRGSH